MAGARALYVTVCVTAVRRTGRDTGGGPDGPLERANRTSSSATRCRAVAVSAAPAGMLRSAGLCRLRARGGGGHRRRERPRQRRRRGGAVGLGAAQLCHAGLERGLSGGPPLRLRGCACPAGGADAWLRTRRVRGRACSCQVLSREVARWCHVVSARTRAPSPLAAVPAGAATAVRRCARWQSPGLRAQAHGFNDVPVVGCNAQRRTKQRWRPLQRAPPCWRWGPGQGTGPG